MSVFGVILVRIFPAFFRIWTKYGEIRSISVFSPNAGKYGKNADQNNFEYRHFLHSVNSHHDSKRIILDNVEILLSVFTHFDLF